MKNRCLDTWAFALFFKGCEMVGRLSALVNHLLFTLQLALRKLNGWLI